MNQSTEPTVYVVDDDEAVRDSLRALIESAGHAVETFSSGEEFLDRFRPDAAGGCLVLDVRMAGMTGIDLQARLRDRGIRMPVIVITGHGDVPLAVTAMKHGAFDFIEKPFANDRILAAIGEGLNYPPSAETTEEQAAARTRLERLTSREREVLELLASGYANKRIAAELKISPRTVEIHRARVIEKLNVQSVSHLVRLALSAGIPLRED